MQENQQSFKEIESFMHILNDWLDETSTQQGTDSHASSVQMEGGEKAKGPQAELVKAAEEAHARI